MNTSGKGVICKVAKPEDMPVDENGNRADVVMDAGSTISRMNLGRLYEQYFGSAARDVSTGVRNILKIQKCSNREAVKAVNAIANNSPETIDQAMSYLLGFYEIISQKQFDYFTKASNSDKLEHLADIVFDGIYVYCPVDSEAENDKIVMELEQKYRPTYGPVKYVGNSGKEVVTKSPFRIGPMYLMLLEKIADDWSSVSSGKLQHFGVLSPVTRSEKYSHPFRNSPVRTIGETEGRIFAGYCGEEAIAEMIDRSNNPVTHKQVIWNILNAPKPGNITYAIDRKVIPVGGSKPIQLLNHISLCCGWKPVYEPEDK